MDAYRVETIHNCHVVYGHMPIVDFASLVKPGKCIDPHLSRRLGANFVFGEPKDLVELRQHAKTLPLPLRLIREVQACKSYGLSENAVEWVINGERGVSCEFIFWHLTGVCVSDVLPSNDCHPTTLSEFIRCQRLLESVTELKASFPRMALISPVWERLTLDWTDILRQFEHESPNWRNQPWLSPKAAEKLASSIAGAGLTQ